MRYITDLDGYLKEVSFGADIECNGQTCTEYTGAVPADYLTLEDWYLSVAENGTINAYYVDSGGDLVLDPSKEADIRATTRQEALLCGLIIPPNEDKFTAADADKIKQFIMGQTTLTDAEKKKYDVNGDGSVTSSDWMLATKLIEANISRNAPGKITIDPADWREPLKIIDGDGNVVTSLGFEGVSPGPADYVVEQGLSGIWTYRKWASGVAECWGIETSSTTASTEGGLYFKVVYSAFPTSLFINVPTVEVTAKGNWIGGAMTGDGLTKDVWQGYVWCATDHTANLLPHIHAIGRWK